MINKMWNLDEFNFGLIIEDPVAPYGSVGVNPIEPIYKFE